MVGTYNITWEKEIVGSAKVEKQGLYLLFSCRCCLPDAGLYRVHVICGEDREDLGICIPVGEQFGMDKKIPAKRLGGETLKLELVPKDWKPQEGIFVPVSDNEPFEYLDRLEDAVSEERDGETGILIRTDEDEQETLLQSFHTQFPGQLE